MKLEKIGRSAEQGDWELPPPPHHFFFNFKKLIISEFLPQKLHETGKKIGPPRGGSAI